MIAEEKIKSELESKFAYLNGAVVVKRARRIFVDVAQDKFFEVFNYAIKQMGFNILVTITGMDTGSAFDVIYHLALNNGIMLNVRNHLSRENPSIETVAKYFLSADSYERELVDLLGIKVLGLPPGNRYPLPDNWPEGEYPLRKDWKDKENVEAGGENV
jgi:NADH:ubiquinone oxidoreductase subunit C